MSKLADDFEAKVKQLTRELKSCEDRFRNIIEKNADGIIIVDRGGTVRFINPTAEKLFDRTAGEFQGELLGFPMLSGEITEINIIRKDGETSIVEMRVVETEWEGKVVYLVSLRDITERKEAEEIRQQLQEFESALAHQQVLTGWQEGAVTAQMAGVGPLSERSPKVFKYLQSKYATLLDTYLEALAFKQTPPRREINALSDYIGNQGCGPRDVVDLHIRTVTSKSKGVHPKRAKAYTMEGRLLALEIMGHLVDYYRMGRRSGDN